MTLLYRDSRAPRRRRRGHRRDEVEAGVQNPPMQLSTSTPQPHPGTKNSRIDKIREQIQPQALRRPPRERRRDDGRAAASLFLPAMAPSPIHHRRTHLSYQPYIHAGNEAPWFPTPHADEIADGGKENRRARRRPREEEETSPVSPFTVERGKGRGGGFATTSSQHLTA
jgi:hypothetical protein